MWTNCSSPSAFTSLTSARSTSGCGGATTSRLAWTLGKRYRLVNTPAIVLPLIFAVWYLVSVKDRYQGPVRTLEEDEITAGV